MTVSVNIYILLFCLLRVIAFAQGKILVELEENDTASIRIGNGQSANASDILPRKFVYGGIELDIGEVPVGMVRLQYVAFAVNYTRVLCGGSLLSDRYVLTAAHCILDDDDERLKGNHYLEIYLGDYDTSTYPLDCKENKCIWNRLVYPDKTIKHPDYDPNTGNNDIALERLAQRIHFTESIKPLPLLPFDVDTPDFKDVLLIAGWGSVNDKGDLARTLQFSVMQLRPKNECSFKNYPFVPPSSLCLKSIKYDALQAYVSDKTSACNGDSGGPAFVIHEDKYYLAGVAVLVAKVCGEMGINRYTNAFRYTAWIKSHLEVA